MLNTGLRTKAKNDFEKYFLKLIYESVYGKTFQNVKNRIGYILLLHEEKA